MHINKNRKIKIKKLTPDRSKETNLDKNGIPYAYGNRKSRFFKLFHRDIKLEQKSHSKKNKLPKELLVKGKSKFLELRLLQDKVKNISELYILCDKNNIQ